VPDGSIHWIILEHADLLHADAQAFLRRIIETSVGGTRFILEVRDLASIAEPLLSRTVLVTGPRLLDHELCAEVLKRARGPEITMERARQIAAQAGGNVRWAVLQALGSGDPLVSAGAAAPETMTWASVLSFMEEVQRSGSSPRHSLPDPGPTSIWERAGGICPWSLLALALSKRIPGS
jgi:DNA polymerase III delta prime subunit